MLMQCTEQIRYTDCDCMFDNWLSAVYCLKAPVRFVFPQIVEYVPTCTRMFEPLIFRALFCFTFSALCSSSWKDQTFQNRSQDRHHCHYFTGNQEEKKTSIIITLVPREKCFCTCLSAHWSWILFQTEMMTTNTEETFCKNTMAKHWIWLVTVGF